MTDYLTVAEVLAMHIDLIERYGGAHGVHDPGLLESALFRPQTGYYSDLIEEAAALWEVSRKFIRSWTATNALLLLRPILFLPSTMYGSQPMHERLRTSSSVFTAQALSPSLGSAPGLGTMSL